MQWRKVITKREKKKTQKLTYDGERENSQNTYADRTVIVVFFFFLLIRKYFLKLLSGVYAGLLDPKTCL